MNGILERQNSSPFLRLLRARAHIYMSAGRLQWIQFALSVVVPMIAAIAGIIWQETRPWIGVLALTLAICDVSWLDRMQRRKLRPPSSSGVSANTIGTEMQRRRTRLLRRRQRRFGIERRPAPFSKTRAPGAHANFRMRSSSAALAIR